MKRTTLVLVLIVMGVFSSAEAHGVLVPLERRIVAVQHYTTEAEVLQKKIAESQTLEEEIDFRHDYIEVLEKLALEYAYLQRETDRVTTLATLESQFSALERHGTKNPVLLKDVMRHVDFLTEEGLGGIEKGNRIPLPDYVRAIEVLEQFRGQFEGAVNTRIKEITKPWVGLAATLGIAPGDVLVEVFLRNVSKFILRVENLDATLTPLFQTEVPVYHDSVDSHRTYIRVFLLRNIGTGAQLQIACHTEGSEDLTIKIPTEGERIAGYQLDSQINNLAVGSANHTNIELWAAYLNPQYKRLRGASHNMGQACSLCHVPGPAGN